ncbi:hypothetical protein DEO72_LG11g2057 [Vigna unguiculata]|uniref:Uncharacterized protein n=1 Tax=Vigna unguiculata TaxID=3917 RepID=A0A4D6NRC7_VIGUN|nr:hypothetical protein DEO72_LG11g2057 [Vigna unguiculata]
MATTSTSLDDNLKIPFAASTYKPQLVEHVRETCYGPHSVTPEGNLLGPIRTSHNSHTHTGNTHQFEPQLKECHMFTLYLEPQLKGCHSESQLKGCHSEPQLKECHVFTLYLEPQLKGYHFKPQLKECYRKFHP